MSNGLNKVRQNNLANFQKAKQRLLQLGCDIPTAVAAITYPVRPTSFAQNMSRQALLGTNNQNRIAQQREVEESEDDSFGVAFDAYLRNKQHHNQPPTFQQNNHAISKRTVQQPVLDLQQYRFDSTQHQPQGQSKARKGALSKVTAKQAAKQSKQPSSSLITLESQLNKVKLSDVFSPAKPLKLNYIKADNRQWENTNPENDKRLYEALRHFPSIKQFHNNQKGIIKCALTDNDIFVCMPTGGGKSLTFQVLTYLRKAVYICLLPLVSLIFDQHQQAAKFGIEAYSLTANSTKQESSALASKLYHFEQSSNSILIFCTPQKINLSPQFADLIERLYRRQEIGRFIIDEVHCVSTWGKDFRAQYEKLSSLRQKYPRVPIMGLTATVTEIIKQDIISRLGIEGCYFFQSSFNRPNLYYEVREKSAKNIVEDIEGIINRYRGKSGLIYCLSKRDCEELSAKLNNRGHRTAYYHADLPEQDKKLTQQLWMDNNINIIVATVAFGMGINKSDVRFVIHERLAKSLENYYQESGRAGRDGLHSECILFYRKSDKQFLQSMNLQNDFSTLEHKQFSSKQLAEMIKYCEDKSTCRRVLQLHYLGENDFTAASCKQTCDNCRHNQQYQQVECIQEAKALLNVIREAEHYQLTLSKKQLIDIIKDKTAKHIQYKVSKLAQKIDLPAVHLLFRHWKPHQIESLVVELISCELLLEKVVKTHIFRNNKQSEVVNVYLKTHSIRTRLFLEKVQTLPMKRLQHKKYTSYVEETEGEEGSLQQPEEETVLDKERDQRYEKYRQLLDEIYEDQELEQ